MATYVRCPSLTWTVGHMLGEMYLYTNRLGTQTIPHDLPTCPLELGAQLSHVCRVASVCPVPELVTGFDFSQILLHSEPVAPDNDTNHDLGKEVAIIASSGSLAFAQLRPIYQPSPPKQHRVASC